MPLFDQRRDKRAAAGSAAEAVLTLSAETGGPMTAEDLAEHARAVADEREELTPEEVAIRMQDLDSID